MYIGLERRATARRQVDRMHTAMDFSNAERRAIDRTTCAKNIGRQVGECTRGVKNCPCLLEKMQEALATIGFPKRGTNEEDMDAQDMATYVQQNFSRTELGI